MFCIDPHYGGIGHMKKNLTKKANKQNQYINHKIDHSNKYGGELRKKRAGRFKRPLSTKAPHHIVFKVNKKNLRHQSLRSVQGFLISQLIIKKYAKKFFIKIEQVTVQNDHIHLMIRTYRRSLFHNFFRVVAGQIAQQFQKAGLLRMIEQKKQSLWKHRPFSHMIKGHKAYKTVRDYIQLNEQEAIGVIPYRKERLRGLTNKDRRLLWQVQDHIFKFLL